MLVKIADLRRDREALQARKQMDLATVDDYATDMRNGDAFPAVVVFDDGEAKYLADGFHRVDAAELAGLDAIDADVRPGTRLDALRYAVQANRAHGLRRTIEDKERALEMLLATPEYADASIAALAEAAVVSQGIASRVAIRIRGKDAPGATRRGKDGNRYKARRPTRHGTQAGAAAGDCPACVANGDAENHPTCRWCHGELYMIERKYNQAVEAVQAQTGKGKAAA